MNQVTLRTRTAARIWAGAFSEHCSTDEITPIFGIRREIDRQGVVFGSRIKPLWVIEIPEQYQQSADGFFPAKEINQ